VTENCRISKALVRFKPATIRFLQLTICYTVTLYHSFHLTVQTKTGLDLTSDLYVQFKGAKS